MAGDEAASLDEVVGVEETKGGDESDDEVEPQPFVSTNVWLSRVKENGPEPNSSTEVELSLPSDELECPVCGDTYSRNHNSTRAPLAIPTIIGRALPRGREEDPKCQMSTRVSFPKRWHVYPYGESKWCGHHTCRECYIAHVQAKVEDYKLVINCPGDASCRASLDTARLRMLLVGPQASAEWNQGPSAGSERDWDTRARKESSLYRTYMERLDGDASEHLEELKASGLWEELSEFTKPCPRCHRLINRSTGCDNMTCLCGCAFCYRCGCARHPNGEPGGCICWQNEDDEGYQWSEPDEAAVDYWEELDWDDPPDWDNYKFGKGHWRRHHGVRLGEQRRASPPAEKTLACNKGSLHLNVEVPSWPYGYRYRWWLPPRGQRHVYMLQAVQPRWEWVDKTSRWEAAGLSESATTRNGGGKRKPRHELGRSAGKAGPKHVKARAKSKAKSVRRKVKVACRAEMRF